ncbi:hypothetical protein AJ79_03662 [Helicocarpus griseus UAMH5409]|uniref:Zinc/iron permease n=1 Tax=Helicocarpus griseus UAMH5409 TaxID=1447875 RepID=A0A2B7XX74_9EURO|nr:hypothetical protein AJ79_03662 [Helicocarpus griseus UAMH5409]
MVLDNDTRGWIMSCVSGVACVLGSSIICVDVIANNCCGYKNFRIADSNVFLSSSLSLSSGVLLFTSLYSMLPTSKTYLTQAGYSTSASAFILIGLFLAGVVIIQLVSSFIHRHIPSHVVDCMHTHEPNVKGAEEGNGGIIGDYHSHNAGVKTPATPPTEQTPLIPPEAPSGGSHAPSPVRETPPSKALVPYSRVPLTTRLTRRIASLVGGTKPFCDQDGPCYGLSHACGKECTKIMIQKDTIKHMTSQDSIVCQHGIEPASASASNMQSRSQSASNLHQPGPVSGDGNISLGIHDLDGHIDGSAQPYSTDPATHHHHVPQNAFLSIGLQTSLAIALHKLPEGFITYATNHASPRLGFSVFLALFIHNITEGFAMALPLYLALNSRLNAMIWSSLLGGISQPAGAGIAAIWIWGAGKASGGGDRAAETDSMSWAVYGGMFAATAGVMTSVSLQLFSEGLVLSHNRSLCIAFAVLGMGILGLSFALTA